MEKAMISDGKKNFLSENIVNKVEKRIMKVKI